VTKLPPLAGTDGETRLAWVEGTVGVLNTGMDGAGATTVLVLTWGVKRVALATGGW
jgi:hypothetical protein